MLIKFRNFMALTFLSCLLAACLYSYPNQKSAGDRTSQPAFSPESVSLTTKTDVPVAEEDNDNFYKLVDVQCQDFLQGKWGTGPTEFGNAPYQPAFDEKGNMFIADPHNGKVLRYPAETTKPDVILIRPEYVLDGNSNYTYWSNVSVSQGKIYLLFSSFNLAPRVIRNLAILSLDGKEQETISLEPYHPYDLSIYSTPVIADQMGGVYVLLDTLGVVHYDATHQSVLTQLPHPETLMIGRDSEIYTYDLKDLQVTFFRWGNNLSPLSTHSGDFSIDLEPYLFENGYYIQVLGIDSQNRIYLSLSGKTEIKLIRFLPGETTRLMGDVPQEWVSNVYGFSVAPDGALYSLVYDRKDASQQPKIIQCLLNEK